jgi:hypothetical protein
MSTTSLVVVVLVGVDAKGTVARKKGKRQGTWMLARAVMGTTAKGAHPMTTWAKWIAVATTAARAWWGAVVECDRHGSGWEESKDSEKWMRWEGVEKRRTTWVKRVTKGVWVPYALFF